MITAFGGTNIRWAGYATFGTEELSELAIEAMTDRIACLLANHGMIAIGESLAKAMWRAVELETIAWQYYLCLLIGGPVLLSEQASADTLKSFSGYGLQDGKGVKNGSGGRIAPRLEGANRVRPHRFAIVPVLRRLAHEQASGSAIGAEYKKFHDLLRCPPLLACNPLISAGTLRIGQEGQEHVVKVNPVLVSANEKLLHLAELEGIESPHRDPLRAYDVSRNFGSRSISRSRNCRAAAVRLLELG